VVNNRATLAALENEVPKTDVGSSKVKQGIQIHWGKSQGTWTSWWNVQV